MRMRAGWVAAAALALCGAQCRPKDTAGSTGPRDASFVVDGGCVIIGLDCGQIGDCAGPCGTSQGCVDGCNNDGCPSAREAFGNIRACTIRNCWTRCAGGDSPDCSACSAEKCAAEHSACDTNSCPVDCSGVDGGVAFRDAGTDGGGGGTASCAGVYACLGTCIAETPLLCVAPCKSRGCDAGVAALETLFTCADEQCKDLLGDRRCFGGYSSGDCRACMEEKCAPQWAACASQACR